MATPRKKSPRPLPYQPDDELVEAKIDESVRESFPASDPPAGISTRVGEPRKTAAAKPPKKPRKS
jgi:hypothetical protein